MGSIFDWSTTPANNATADASINWAEGQAPSTVNNSARVMMERVKEFISDIAGVNTVGGTANSITVTATSPFSAYSDGLILRFKPTATVTGAATLNANSVGAKSIRKFVAGGEVATGAGDMAAGGMYELVYFAALNSAAGGWLLTNPQSDLKETYVSQAGNYTALATDNNAVHLYTAATPTVSLTAAATLGANWHYTIIAYGGPVIIDPNGAETINGNATLTLSTGTSTKIICDGTNFFTEFKPNAWEPIGDYPLSAAASLPIINLSAFEMIRISGYVETSATGGVFIRTSSNNGSSYDSGAADYGFQGITGTGSTASATSLSTTSMVIAGSVDAGANFGVNFDCQLYNFNKAKFCRFKSSAVFVASATFAESLNGGSRAQATARNAFTLFPLSGTLTGRVIVEGIR
jgi:hypothetical protein